MLLLLSTFVLISEVTVADLHLVCISAYPDMDCIEVVSGLVLTEVSLPCSFFIHSM